MPAISQDQIAEIISRRQAGEYQPAIAFAMGIGMATVNRYCQIAAKKGELGTRPVLDGFEITKITSKDEDGNSVVTQPAADSLADKLLPGHIVERSTLKIGTDWHKTKLSPGTLSREDLLEIFAEYRGKAELIRQPQLLQNHELTTVYTTSDLHLGMLAWGKETGTPWDLKIACDTIRAYMGELITYSPPSAIAILLDLGDYTHNNNQSNTTQSGHQLDVDGRFRKIGKEAMRLRLQMIELLLQKHERVILRSLPGNHDSDTAGIMSGAFSLFLENNERVTVDDDPSEFWVHEFGVNMFCGNHGHKTKPSRLPGIMAARWPEIWGRTKVRQAWSGHIHHTTSDEENGARWETLRTAAPGDSYGHSHGFTAGRELRSHTYHLTRGWRGGYTVQIL